MWEMFYILRLAVPIINALISDIFLLLTNMFNKAFKNAVRVTLFNNSFDHQLSNSSLKVNTSLNTGAAVCRGNDSPTVVDTRAALM